MAMPAAPAVVPWHKSIVPMSAVVVPPRAAMMVSPSPMTVMPPMTMVPVADLLNIGRASLGQSDPSASGRNQRRCGWSSAKCGKRGGEDDCETLLPHGTSSFSIGCHFLWS